MGNIIEENVENTKNLDTIDVEESNNISNNTLPYIIDGQALVNNIIDIKYIGNLIDECINDKKIFMHYGYGLLWENPNKLELIKGENNIYYISLKLEDFDSISFCFRDELDNWDLNKSGSYCLPILKKENVITKVESQLPFIPEETSIFAKIIGNIKKFFWKFFKNLSQNKI